MCAIFFCSGSGGHIRVKPAPLLGFLAGHKSPTDGLCVFENAGLDGFVFGGGGHVFRSVAGFFEFESHFLQKSRRAFRVSVVGTRPADI